MKPQQSPVGSSVIFVTLMLACLFTQAQAGQAASQRTIENELQPVTSFAAIKNDKQRALALFAELGKVIQHPRCVNCHPRTERPLQGDIGVLHEPLVVRGLGGIGAPGMFCTSCHGAGNFQIMPGNPVWRLAPASMAWEGESLGAICEQIKDTQRNGGKTLAQLGKHMAEDKLVGYGWNPPEHLQAVPGDQKRFGELFYAWLDAGAHCPKS